MSDTPLTIGKIPLWLVYGLLATFSFGVWGLLSTIASRNLSPWHVQVISTFGMVPVAIVSALSKDFLSGTNLWRGLGWGLFTGAGTAAANVALFTALSRGAEASVIFPLTGMFPVISIFTAWLVLGERVGRAQKVGIAMALVAILLFNLVTDAAPDAAAVSSVSAPPSSWMGLALVCLVGWGVTGVTQKLAVRDISNGLAMVSFVVANLMITLLVVLAQPIDWNVPLQVWALCLAVGICFGLGTLFLFAAYPAGGKVTIVSVLGALYPAITVAFAVPVLGERIGGLKGCGIVLALAAAVVLSWEDTASKRPETLVLDRTT